MTGGLELARRTVRRQVEQSALAICIALLGFVAGAPIVPLARALSEVAERQNVPLREPTLIMIFGTAALVVSEALFLRIIKGRMRPCLLVGILLGQAVVWAVAVAIAMRLGSRWLGASCVPIGAFSYLLGAPMACFFTPGQSCATRLRRSAREIKLAVTRMVILSTGMTVIMYVYLTVFTQLTPALEVVTMGVGMPLLQATCMLVLAQVASRQERAINRRRANFVRPQGDQQREPDLAVGPVKPMSKRSRMSSVSVTRAQSNKSRIASLMVAISTEMLYSCGAFAALALARSEQTFLLSLASMITIEIVQVGLRVKARGVVRAVTESTGVMLMNDDVRLLQWLLYRELGEKVGVLLALGLLATDKAFGRDVAMQEGVDAARLARRGFTMVLMEVAGDFVKNLVSHKLGLAHSDEAQVLLLPVTIAYFGIEGIVAASLVYIGLTIGSVALST